MQDRTEAEPLSIDLRSELSLANAWRFPIQTAESRRNLVIGGLDYWKAWGVVLPTILTSFLGLLAVGVGFLWTSVWFWQAAAFCSATVFTQRFSLDEGDGGPMHRAE